MFSPDTVYVPDDVCEPLGVRVSLYVNVPRDVPRACRYAPQAASVALPHSSSFRTYVSASNSPRSAIVIA
jgi:hypothetical protein